MINTVDSTVEISSTYHILCTAIHRNIVAVFFDMERERTKGFESWKKDLGGYVFGCAGGDEV